MTLKIPQITQDELKRVLIVGCHLHKWQGEDVRGVFQEQGLVQLDPLNPAGRYHDLFFSARILNYKQGDFERTVYPEKLAFETYFHNLNAIYIEYFPLFYSQTLNREHLGRYYSRALKILEETHPDMLEQVLKYVQDHGPTRSSDLVDLGKADPKYAIWKTSRNSGTALELLWAMGKLAVIRDNCFRKMYDIIERYVDEAKVVEETFTEEDEQFLKLKLKLQSFPVTYIGKISVSKNGTVKTRKKLGFSLNKIVSMNDEDNRNKPSLVQLENDSTSFIIPSNWHHLSQEPLDDEMRAIGPLDPLIWDRNLNKLFDFEYVWEVYKKPKDRVWGYYVYPILYQGDFIGRFEVKFDSKLSILRFFNFQEEENVNVDPDMVDAYYRLVSRWKNMVGAGKVEYDSSIPFEH